jgi:hypothetical protein
MQPEFSGLVYSLLKSTFKKKNSKSSLENNKNKGQSTGKETLKTKES